MKSNTFYDEKIKMYNRLNKQNILANKKINIKKIKIATIK